MKKLKLFITLVLFIPAIISGQGDKLSHIIKSGSLPERLSGDFSFTEGPAADAGGNVYFTDQPNDRIMVWKDGEGVSVFMQPSGRSNGMYFDNQGYLWSCADEKNELWRIGPDKKVEVIIGSYEGKLFNGPNDLWIAPNGSIYLTDPFYKRPWWKHSEMPQDTQCVYYLSHDRRVLKRVAGDLGQPNGITGTPDGKKLYVADIGRNKTWSYSINPDGSLGNKTLFCDLGSDGMTIDTEGNLYLTGKGVTIFDKTGKLIGNIAIPESWTANVCFGGKERNFLFITASKGLYRIKTNMKGAF